MCIELTVLFLAANPAQNIQTLCKMYAAFLSVCTIATACKVMYKYCDRIFWCDLLIPKIYLFIFFFYLGQREKILMYSRVTCIFHLRFELL
jgi:hypothetical protein